MSLQQDRSDYERLYHAYTMGDRLSDKELRKLHDYLIATKMLLDKCPSLFGVAQVKYLNLTISNLGSLLRDRGVDMNGSHIS